MHPLTTLCTPRGYAGFDNAASDFDGVFASEARRRLARGPGRPRPHRWGRGRILEEILPSARLEPDFEQKVKRLARRRRAERSELAGYADEHFVADDWNAENRTVLESIHPQRTLSCGATDDAKVTSKYLTSACLPVASAQFWWQKRQGAAQRTPSKPCRPSSRQDPFTHRQSDPPIDWQIVEGKVTLAVNVKGLSSPAGSWRRRHPLHDKRDKSELREKPDEGGGEEHSAEERLIEPEESEEYLPPHAWLLLAAPVSPELGFTGSSSPSSPRRSPVPIQSGTVSLAAAAGGGVARIPAGGNAAALLQPVSRARLTIAAAEANFQRAARGTSLVALHHAAVILSAVEDLDALDRRSHSRASPLPPQPLRAGTPVAERARKAAAGIADRVPLAEARTNQTSSYMSPSPPPESLLADMKSPFDKRTQMRKGYYAYLEFKAFAARRFGNAVRVWFKLDPQENMKLGEKQFIRGCEEIGFRGNVIALWRYLDSDQRGVISLLNVCSRSSLLLAEFKHVVRSHFQDSVESTFDYLDDNRSNRILKEEFVPQARQLGLKNAPKLFDVLDRRGLGYLCRSDILFLTNWKPPPYMLINKADNEALQTWKESLLEQAGGNYLRAWRKFLDTDGTMRLTFDEFTECCHRIEQGTKGRSMDTLCHIWRAMDDDCSGWIALREFDLPSFDIVTTFKRWADDTYGSVRKAFRALDVGCTNARLSEGELLKCIRGDKPCRLTRDQIETLFDGLDLACSNFLSESDVKFLDDWDLAWEDWEHENSMQAS
eukprot:TRINITY_DN14360_c0_g3_i1.p1 TRINITY_DN14360_c0_g3~~TRINITY_DN14360_c0_g3_i1.p1  ORF type:complete len:774 (+),score=94.61 TRINITY_DN14360_c0_g3_i1:73-2394(+)